MNVISQCWPTATRNPRVVDTLPFSATKYPKEIKEGRTYLGSQFKDTVHHGGEVMVAEPEAAGHSLRGQKVDSYEYLASLTFSVLFCLETSHETVLFTATGLPDSS